jgi:hypothetical protein
VEGWWESDFFGDSSVLICKSKGRAGRAPFERVILLCYDVQKGKYTAAGAHTAFPSRLLLDEGTYDEASQTISWTEHDILALGSGEKVMAKGEETCCCGGCRFTTINTGTAARISSTTDRSSTRSRPFVRPTNPDQPSAKS